MNLKAFGSYRAGGRQYTIAGAPAQRIQFTRATSYNYDPNGTYCIESAYVQYFVPAERNNLPPVVLLHGGGMSGAMWETTPDGRPGWLHGLLTCGFEVHVVDNVERGRAGWIPQLWPGEPILRPLEEAWTLFRFGDAEGFASCTAYPEQQFPVEYLENFARGFTPRWTSTTPMQVAALKSVLLRVGPAILIAHSQGAEVATTAASLSPKNVRRLVLIEPSGFAEHPQILATIPISLVYGDFLDRTPLWRGLTQKWQRFISDARAMDATVSEIDLTQTEKGASHMPMMDRASDRYLETIMQTLIA